MRINYQYLVPFYTVLINRGRKCAEGFNQSAAGPLTRRSILDRNFPIGAQTNCTIVTLVAGPDNE